MKLINLYRLLLLIRVYNFIEVSQNMIDMKNYKMSFGTIIILENNLAEIIVDDGVEMNLTQVNEYHNFLLNNLTAPFYLLVNRKHSYTYTFDAQKIIVSLDKIKKLAVFLNTQGALMSSETLFSLNTNLNWEISWFSERAGALAWLKEENEIK